MSFTQIFLQAFLVIMLLMTTLWFVSILLKNVSIVDLFWGLGFVITAVFYFLKTDGYEPRKIIITTMVSLWGFRLSAYLAWRNIGKGEDFRYKQFRQAYGEKRYWWISFFQTFLLQGVLMWIISAPLLGAQYSNHSLNLGILDYSGIVLWIVGFIFETVGDYQLSIFRADPSNEGKVLCTGFWKYTRHPNYFGDSAVWWGYGLISLSAGGYLSVFGSVLMTVLIIKVSGVALLEKSLKNQKPEYREYIERTSAFLPWFPKKSKIQIN
jgi:steroid 5-alpha reductase family enzyme